MCVAATLETHCTLLATALSRTSSSIPTKVIVLVRTSLITCPDPDGSRHQAAGGALLTRSWDPISGRAALAV